MNYLHYEFNLTPNDCVSVTLDKQANVRLLDSANYNNYKQGRKHRFYGGLAKQSPINLTPPHSGKWHLVIDTGGNRGTVKASVSVI
ncbi:MAG: DUF1883 domain-containing protein [Bacteroidales bacterium]|nr:DUF1883 domain-containing protein [Bacteroidales bacterium]